MAYFKVIPWELQYPLRLPQRQLGRSHKVSKILMLSQNFQRENTSFKLMSLMHREFYDSQELTVMSFVFPFGAVEFPIPELHWLPMHLWMFFIIVLLTDESGDKIFWSVSFQTRSDLRVGNSKHRSGCESLLQVLESLFGILVQIEGATFDFILHYF